METKLYRASLSKKDGTIGSYFDKQLGRELVPYGVPKATAEVPVVRAELALNVFQVIDEAPNEMTAWHINKIMREENLLKDAEVSLIETGPVFARFRVTHKFRSSQIDEEILFYQGLRRIDFDATIDWREKGSMEAGVPQLKVAFTGAMRAARFRTEGPFYIAERAADGQECPTQKWSDVTGDEFGFTLANDCKYGCDAMGSRMRNQSAAQHVRPRSQIPTNRVHKIRFSFRPHESRRAQLGSHAFRHGIQSPVRGGSRPKPSAKSLAAQLSVEGSDSVVCTALRIAEHSDNLLVRFFETSGKPQRIRFRTWEEHQMGSRGEFHREPDRRQDED